MVQLSWSLSLLSSSVHLSKSAFWVHSCRFCAVKLLFSLFCSEMTVLTAVREETVNSFSHFLLPWKSWKKQLVLQRIMRAIMTDAKVMQAAPKPAATRWSRGHGGALFSFSTKNKQNQNLYYTNLWQNCHVIPCIFLMINYIDLSWQGLPVFQPSPRHRWPPHHLGSLQNAKEVSSKCLVPSAVWRFCMRHWQDSKLSDRYQTTLWPLRNTAVTVIHIFFPKYCCAVTNNTSRI